MRNVRLPGDMIRHYRIKAGMTQQELGVRAGFSESSAGVRIAQYESGNRNTKAEIASRIACALNLSVEKLALVAEEEKRLINIGKMSEEFFDCYGITPRRFAAILAQHNRKSDPENPCCCKCLNCQNYHAR